MVIIGAGTTVTVTGGAAVGSSTATTKLATVDQSPWTGSRALTLQKYCLPFSSLIVTGTSAPAVEGVSVSTVVPNVGVVESWNSYLVVEVTGDQEKAGLWFLMVAPLAGEEIAGTAAAKG